MKQLNGQGSTTDWGYERVFGEFSAFTVIDKYNTDDLFQRNEFFGAPTNAMVEKNPTLAKMELETFSKIIMGDSIDKFDSFVEQWKKLGGDDITKEVNDWNQKNK
jgi:putative aldouronate transport system substrate-binding protein